MAKANRVLSTPRRTASKNTQPANVVKLSDYRKPLPKRKKGESVYELYPLPFLNRKRRCMWDVVRMGEIAMMLFDNPDQGLFVFAVGHLEEMLQELRTHYYAEEFPI